MLAAPPDLQPIDPMPTAQPHHRELDPPAALKCIVAWACGAAPDRAGLEQAAARRFGTPSR
jgi:hypothetical protein